MKNNNIEKKETGMTDEALRSLLKSAALQAPPSPWFTRKVMNRLPEKGVRTAAWIEYAVYLMAALATVIYAVIYGAGVWNTGYVTVGNITMMAICFGLFCSIVFLMVEPWFADESAK